MKTKGALHNTKAKHQNNLIGKKFSFTISKPPISPYKEALAYRLKQSKPL